MNIKSKLLIIAALLAVTSPALADKPGTLGIGLGAGTTANGLSGKYYTGSLAFQANLGTFGGGGLGRYDDFGGLGVSVDVLMENPAFADAGIFTLEWNYGLGAGVGLRDDIFGLAVAGVLGLELNFVPIPLDLVLEYRPVLNILEVVDVELLGFTGHIRYYFQ